MQRKTPGKSAEQATAAANAVKPRLGPGDAARPSLLAGGNPRIAKGEGDAPVQAYIAAMPGWKRDVGRRLDALIAGALPDVRKAVKWNSPLYGMDGQGWFLGVHCFTKAVKVAFFQGASLRPVPPANRRARARATWTSTRTTSLTKAGSSPGSSRQADCRANACEEQAT